METVLLVGKGKLTCSIAVCLLKAGHFVNMWTDDTAESLSSILSRLDEFNSKNENDIIKNDKLKVSESLNEIGNCRVAIVITEEQLTVKRDIIRQLEEKLLHEVIIGINSESISLDALQQNTRNPERIIGLNWSEPAHTTKFLEIISNDIVTESVVEQISELAKQSWRKDPHTVNNFGIRSRLMSAMAREAFYLVENGYASVEDIDRACRNDAGYYLPFAGNCRYMDLMGTYAYGIVMKDLNPKLSKQKHVPVFFTDIINGGGTGMANGKGIYQYTEEEKECWNDTINKFSYRIEKIINKYPFNYMKKKSL